jgi:predicted O-linked N-acetylglucosamine transferase (SPINDLY family)
MYAEQIISLPCCFQPNDERRAASPAARSSIAAERSGAQLPADAVVLCSFNNSYKLTPALFALWLRLLRHTPDSVLWLLGDSAAQQQRLRAHAVQAGIAPERLVFAGRLRYAQHLARLRLADLYLDTLPFNGGASTSDALWAGVPVLSCTGEAFAARMAGSLLTALGLPELVTTTLQEYEQRALELLESPGRLAGLRARLLACRDAHPLFDTACYCRALESAYRQVRKRAESGAPPSGFALSSAQNE